MRKAFASMASNTGFISPGDELMTLSTSAVAVCCSRASLNSRARAATCSWKSAVDTRPVDALRALDLGAPRPFAHCLVHLVASCRPGGSRRFSILAKLSFRAMAGCPLWAISGHLKQEMDLRINETPNLMGMGFPKPLDRADDPCRFCWCGGARFATRQSAGFFVRVRPKRIEKGSDGKHLVSVGTMDGVGADRCRRIVFHNDFSCSFRDHRRCYRG